MIKKILVCDRCGMELRGCYYEAVIEMQFGLSKVGHINGSYCFNCFGEEIVRLGQEQGDMENELHQMEGK